MEADLVGALGVGDVVALDAQGCLGQVEGLGELIKSESALGEVTGTTGLVQAQGFLSVLTHRVHESGLVPALRNTQIDLPSAKPLQPRTHGGGVAGHLGDQDLPRHRGGGCVGDIVDTGGRRLAVASGGGTAGTVGTAAGLGAGGGAVAHPDRGGGARGGGGSALVDGAVVGRIEEGGVDLLEETFDELGVSGVVNEIDDPAALSAHPAATHVKDLDRSLELVADQGENVSISSIGQDDGVASMTLRSAAASSRRRAAFSKSRAAAAAFISDSTWRR